MQSCTEAERADARAARAAQRHRAVELNRHLSDAGSRAGGRYRGNPANDGAEGRMEHPGHSSDDGAVPTRLPLLPLHSGVLLPGCVAHLTFSQAERSVLPCRRQCAFAHPAPTAQRTAD